jgi:putative ABC transport system permease protein
MLNDLRHALRLLRRQPGFTVIASLTLALGIGATAAIFSVVDAALFTPLPYRDADRLVTVAMLAKTPAGQQVPIQVDGNRAAMLRQVSTAFDGVEVFRDPSLKALAAGSGDSPLIGGFGPRFPAFLGVTPQLGRVFDDDDVNGGDTIILSDRFWRASFQADPGVIGRTIAFADRTRTVVGVMPPAFRFYVGAKTDGWLPISDRDGTDLAARLAPGITIDEAQRRLDATLRTDARPERRYEISPTNKYRSDSSSRTMLLSLLAAVACVLVIACANVSNLVLARTLSRQREIAVRGSLGATRAQLVRQFLVEGLVLASIGGAAAVFVAWLVIRSVPSVVPVRLLPLIFGVSLPHLDVRVLAFGCAAALVSGLICGAVPAIRVSGRAAADGLLGGGQRTAGGSRAQRRMRESFLSLQVGLTLIPVPI